MCNLLELRSEFFRAILVGLRNMQWMQWASTVVSQEKLPLRQLHSLMTMGDPLEVNLVYSASTFCFGVKRLDLW
jgi:hypothetical protein